MLRLFGGVGVGGGQQGANNFYTVFPVDRLLF